MRPASTTSALSPFGTASPSKNIYTVPGGVNEWPERGMKTFSRRTG
jgi:hypothetical protein